MGCLFELFFEIVLEGIFEGSLYGYIKLMSLIVPHYIVSEKAKKRIQISIILYSVILMILIIVGLIMLVQKDLDIKSVGRYFIFIRVILIGIQVVLGIISKVVPAISLRRKKDKRIYFIPGKHVVRFWEEKSYLKEYRDNGSLVYNR